MTANDTTEVSNDISTDDATRALQAHAAQTAEAFASAYLTYSSQDTLQAWVNALPDLRPELATILQEDTSTWAHIATAHITSRGTVQASSSRVVSFEPGHATVVVGVIQSITLGDDDDTATEMQNVTVSLTATSEGEDTTWQVAGVHSTN